jgi:hypothetical protein
LSTYGFINNFLGELKSLANPPNLGNRVIADPRPLPCWIPPTLPIAKFNVDASVSKTQDKGVAAAICHDNSCLYLGSSLLVYTGITDPAVLEALACREALALAADLGLSHFMVESDCKNVVADIVEGTLSKYGAADDTSLTYL